jgi:hypothetical protein
MVASTRPGSRLVTTQPPWVIRLALPLLLLTCWATAGDLGAEATPAPPTAGQVEPTNAQEVRRATLQLLEELRATQLAVEQGRQEAREAAAQNVSALSKGLQAIEEAFAAQRSRDLEAMQRDNKLMLIVTITFAAMGFLTMLTLTWFQWRMSKGLADISAALPTSLALGPGAAAGALGPGEPSNMPLVGATEHREIRPRAPEPAFSPAPRRRHGGGRTIERRLFPNAGDAYRRRQFRALKIAVIFGFIFALLMALVLYLVYAQRGT